MSQEPNQEIASGLVAWWSELSFDGKDQFKLEEDGTLSLLPHAHVKERTIATIAADGSEPTLKTLTDKYSAAETRVNELEAEWNATEDKLKLADKTAQVHDYVNQCSGLGDFVKLGAKLHEWEQVIYTLSEENHAAKLKLVEQAESLANSEEWKETTQTFKDIADKWKQTGHIDRGRNDKLWNRIEAARRAFQERKRVHHEDEEKNMLHNLDLKIDLVEQAESLAASEEWKKTSETFMRLTEEWKTIGHTMNKKNEELWQRFIAAKSAFFDRKREHSQKIQVEQEHNYGVKLAIVERAEAIKDSTDWNGSSLAYAAMMEEWKKTGRIHGDKADGLWKRFTEAQDVFFQAKKSHFGNIKSSQENNYQLKKELYERAEALKNSNHWNDVTNEMKQLLEDWKKIGPIPRSYGDKMWDDFMAARKYFFARKDAHREQRQHYIEQQVTVKAEQAKGAVRKLLDDIKEEAEKIADFKIALENITPGKKAAELKAHLEKLIQETTVNLERLKQKYEQGQKDMQAAEAKATEPKKPKKEEGGSKKSDAAAEATTGEQTTPDEAAAEHSGEEAGSAEG